MNFNISLVISTYNWPEALEVCLKSALHQRLLPNEIIIADDGSGEPTREVIARFKAVSPIPILHIWHEDNGFRLAHIRNKAIAAATGHYIVQVDGDILMHRYFISDHARFARQGSFVRASRIFINEEMSGRVIQAKVLDPGFFRKGTNNFFSAIRLPLLWPLFETGYKNKGDERYEIHGCNMAFWKKDAVLVNGYNEAFTGWGSEDKEFVARLLNAGKKKRFLKQGGIAFHLYHPENVRTNMEKNIAILRQTIESKSEYCMIGLNKYMN